MPQVKQVTIAVENRGQELFVEGMFRKLVEAGTVLVRMCWGPTGMIAMAQRVLHEHPELAVALVFEEKHEEQEGPARRLLARVSDDGWFVTIARPGLDAWAALDPQVDQQFNRLATAAVDESVPRVKQARYRDRAVCFKELTQPGAHVFDLAEARQLCPELDELASFVGATLAHPVSTP